MHFGSFCVGIQGCRSENEIFSGGSGTETCCSADWNADESGTWTWSVILILNQNAWMLWKGWENQTCSPSWVGQDSPDPIWTPSEILSLRTHSFFCFQYTLFLSFRHFILRSSFVQFSFFLSFSFLHPNLKPLFFFLL